MNPLLDKCAELAQNLRDAGHTVTTDDELITAASRQFLMDENTLRMVLSGGDDVVTIDPEDA